MEGRETLVVMEDQMHRNRLSVPETVCGGRSIN